MSHRPFSHERYDSTVHTFGREAYSASATAAVRNIEYRTDPGVSETERIHRTLFSHYSSAHPSVPLPAVDRSVTASSIPPRTPARSIR